MVLVGFDGKQFYSTKSAPFEWARDLMIPAEEDAKIFKENLPYSIERKAASNWHEMLIGSLDDEPTSEEVILSGFIYIAGDYLGRFVNHYDKIITDSRIGLTQEETWMEALVQFLHICQMLNGEDYDYVRPENLVEIYKEGESKAKSEIIRQKAINAYQSNNVEGYVFWSNKLNEIRKNYRK